MKTNKQPNLWPAIKLRLAAVVITGFVLLGISGRSIAANVTWQTPQVVSGDTDVATNGVYVGTIVGAAGVGKTVNTVTFVNDANATYDGWGLVFGMDAQSSSLSTNYQAVIGTGDPNPSTVTLNGLTVGHQYLVQFWVGDWRSYVTPDCQQTITGGANVSGVMHWADGDNNEGGVHASYIIGTFTADATSQVFAFNPNNGNGTQFNAMQLRDLSSAVQTWSLSYNGNGNDAGSAPVDANSPYNNGATVTVLGNTGGMTLAGSVFTNWNTAANGSGTTYNPGATFVITQPTTLYAQWAYKPVAWGSATNLTGDADVSTTGTLVYAYTESGVAATCNGVTFAADSSATSLGGGNVTLSGFIGGVYAGFDPSGSFSSDYHNLINGGAYGATGGSVTLNNLTSGRKYLVQLWVVDYRGDGFGRTVVLDNQTTLTYNPPQYAIGTFTATGTSQLIKLAANASVQINAIQVRDITPVVAWGAATTLTGDTDVATNGTLVYAYTESGVSATCNGVTFAAGSSETSLGGGNVTLSGFAPAAVYAGFDVSGSYSTDYHNLITGGAYGFQVLGTVTLNNLTHGRQYLVQTWVVDNRGDGVGRTTVLDNQTTLNYNPGEYAIGTFTASGTSQSFTLTPNSSLQFTAIQVRDVSLYVPPPGITNQPSSRTNYANTRVSFTVAATNATSYQWYFNTNTPVAGATTPTLNLPNVQLTNAGTYYVVVANIGGAVTSSVVRLTVLTNLTVNGDFENPVTSFDNFGGGSTGVFAWTVDNAPPDGVSLGGPTLYANDNGSQNLQLTGASSYSTGGGISQTIATKPGTTYVVSIDVASRQANAVTGNFQFGTQSQGITASSRTFTTLTWQVVASGSNTVIDITGFTNSAAGQLIIDNVYVFPSVAATPPKITMAVSGSQLTLNWTGTGSLEWQTNTLSQGLRTNWVAYPNGTNGVTVPVDTTKGCVFFRVKQ